jgi:hypothetical protein
MIRCPASSQACEAKAERADQTADAASTGLLSGARPDQEMDERLIGRTGRLIKLSIALVVATDCRRRSDRPSVRTVRVSSRPSRTLAAALGYGSSTVGNGPKVRGIAALPSEPPAAGARRRTDGAVDPRACPESRLVLLHRISATNDGVGRLTAGGGSPSWSTSSAYAPPRGCFTAVGVLARQCVQLRLACSVGASPTGGKVRDLRSLGRIRRGNETDEADRRSHLRDGEQVTGPQRK